MVLGCRDPYFIGGGPYSSVLDGGLPYSSVHGGRDPYFIVLDCGDPYFIVLDGRDPYSSRVYLTVFHAVSIMG